jgi:AraC-like DNA-binding protein
MATHQRSDASVSVSSYREFAPSVLLRQDVLCLWTQSISGSAGEYAQRVLPDGCIDIVLINGEPPDVVGPWTKPFVARLPPGTMIVGARFHPGHAPGLLGLPASRLLNQSVPLCSVWSKTLSAEFARVADKPALPERLRALEGLLQKRLMSAAPMDEAIRAAIAWLARNPHGRIRSVSDRIGMSPRQLQRRFCWAVGYGPKMFQSIVRFQRAIDSADGTGEQRTLAEVAVDAGYADQAHMTREVQRFSGRAPGALFQSANSALRLSGFFCKHEGVDT